MHRARGAPARVWQFTLPGSRSGTLPRLRLGLALYGDEVRILIFDDPAELEKSQRPVMVRSGRGPFKPARPRRARAMHEIFFENLRNPAHNRRAGLMRQFSSSQLYSMKPWNL